MFKLPRFSLPASTDLSAVDRFVAAANRTPLVRHDGQGRLIFALDATMSRQPTWDLAAHLQTRMFDEAAGLGGLDIQLVYFRGASECRASRFLDDSRGLARAMRRISVAAGRTQLGRVLAHAAEESARERVAACVFIGDAVEENATALWATAGELALLGTKVFMFHEGQDAATASVFREIARLTGGAYAPFDAAAPDVLAALLAAVAAFSAGGTRAVQALRISTGSHEVRALLAQIR